MDIIKIKKTIIPVLKKYGIRRASLFGSVVRGDNHKSSDVDILVEIPKKIQGFKYIGMKMDLQEDLGKKLKKKVDLVEFDYVKKSLKKYILPSQIPILP